MFKTNLNDNLPTKSTTFLHNFESKNYFSVVFCVYLVIELPGKPLFNTLLNKKEKKKKENEKKRRKRRGRGIQQE